MPLRDRDEECKITESIQLPRYEILADTKGSPEDVKSNANSYLTSFVLTTASCIFLFSLYWYVVSYKKKHLNIYLYIYYNISKKMLP